MLIIVLLVLLMTATPAMSVSGRNVVLVRGKKVDLYYYPATGAKLNRRVLFVPGDGGWRGWAITVAGYLASWGYDVYGLDTRQYLVAFTSGRTVLKESEIMSDFRTLANWVTKGSGEKITLVGWSEGAGLGVLAAADSGNHRCFNGLIAFGLVMKMCWAGTGRIRWCPLPTGGLTNLFSERAPG